VKHIDKKLLRSLHAPGRCENCKTVCKSLDPHHIWGRGHGGGCRLDIMLNLVCLGTAFDCDCHAKAQAHIIPVCDMTGIVAKREHEDPDDVTAVIWFLQSLPRGLSDKRQHDLMVSWPLAHSAVVLCVRTLMEMQP